ncbi:bifunctional serine/threonine-protein kinase/ABC transporter substrate-binding protein [Streptomyces sp. NPDC005931]|uniref:bifunctional serine/threonine-protein kinase/ABC transporter substrate-binding protein n=1 Tax=Streptomyces sp. NPDC005931 TaxID=3364737 RepID=UPI00369FD4DC
MEPLVASDPSRLGGYRLLGRLGAGGMGVVYLGRAADGELAAVKAIQPEYGGQAEFRARFRREIASARRVVSPWVVPVLGADTEAGAPWLATAFVPGPSLDEAVAACGPLPVRVVRSLGNVLAQALSAVHEARLVHRDVKPGNVLLALDGPRLIDFGIARPTAAEETALTTGGMVVGTAGFFSPEQARAGRVGSASDVFSLGCVLAYASTARPPFGTGTVDALLYRTVHDAPDLDGVDDPALRALLDRCLAKEPGDRPTAAEVAGELIGEAGDVPAGSLDWLPEAVLQMVADRSAETLALAGIEPTEISQPAGTSEAPAPAAPGRRRILTLAAGGAALIATGGGTALWTAVWGGDEAPATARAAGRRWVIGVHADLTGPLQQAGRAQEKAARLAVEQFNSRKDKPFALSLEVIDDRGEATRARHAARRLTGDRDVLAVVGPTGYASTQGAVEVYESAGLPLLTVSELSLGAARTVLLAKPRVYFQAASHTSFASAVTVLTLQAHGARRLGLMADRAGRAVSWDSADMARQVANSKGLGLYPRVVPSAASELGPVVTDMLDHGIDSFYYTGTPERAAVVARALAASQFHGPRFLDPASATSDFISGVGRAAEGWQLVAPYTSPEAVGMRGFNAAYRHRYGEAPGTWAIEAYDVTRLITGRLTVLAARDGRRPSRERLADALARAEFKGLAGMYAFDEDRWLKLPRAYHYRVAGGRFTYVGLPRLGQA